jgi:hypothetical protein
MKGQANYIDFVVALGLFLIMLFLFISFTQSQRAEMYASNEALMISDALMSQGIPENWTEEEYYRPGLLINNELSANRWVSFHNLMVADETEMQRRYTLLSQFMVRIGNYTNNEFIPMEINGITFITTNNAITPGDLEALDTGRIDRIERAVSYNGSIVIMEVVAWR